MTPDNDNSTTPTAGHRLFNNLESFAYRHRVKMIMAALVSLFTLILLWDTIIVTIPAGYQGVYWSRFFGGTKNWIITEGTGIKLPWDEIALYDMREKEVHQTTAMLTKDGLTVLVSWSARFHPEPNLLPLLHKNIGPSFTEVAVIPEVIELLRHMVSNYRADQIYEKGSLNAQLASTNFNPMQNVPIHFDDIMVLKFVLPEEVAKGIQAKLLAEQTMLSYVFKLQTEEQERKRKNIEAEGIHDFEKISGISMLKWRGIDATIDLAKSPNSKIIIMGTGDKSLPLLLNSSDK